MLILWLFVKHGQYLVIRFHSWEALIGFKMIWWEQHYRKGRFAYDFCFYVENVCFFSSIVIKNASAWKYFLYSRLFTAVLVFIGLNSIPQLIFSFFHFHVSDEFDMWLTIVQLLLVVRWCQRSFVFQNQKFHFVIFVMFDINEISCQETQIGASSDTMGVPI